MPFTPLFDAYRSIVLPLREQAALRNRWLKQRLDTVLPARMAAAGIDCWIVIGREYAEDPVLLSLIPEPKMSARRRAILLFTRQADGTVERISLGRYGSGELYQPAWDPDQEDQYTCLARTVRERNPDVIGLDVSPTFAFGDGLTHGEYQSLAEALGPEWLARTRSAEELAVGWLETRLDEELTVYPSLVRLGHALIAQAFSLATVIPGVTTTEELEWWFRQQLLSLGLLCWFQPIVDRQPAIPGDPPPADKVIQPGDLLHCDVGFHYLGLATDQQQNAYVLRPGETQAPAYLECLLAAANRIQDIHLDEMAPGRTGNQVLAGALARAGQEQLGATIYTHPLGVHGHAAGPTIGLWDQQQGVPGRGDYALHDRTCYAIELNAAQPVAELGGRVIKMAVEEDAALVAGAMRWLDGRQTALHLIG
jgi:hypothetical protein